MNLIEVTVLMRDVLAALPVTNAQVLADATAALLPINRVLHRQTCSQQNMTDSFLRSDFETRIDNTTVQGRSVKTISSPNEKQLERNEKKKTMHSRFVWVNVVW